MLIDEEARIALAEGDYPRAMTLFKRLLKIDPYDVRALREAGRLANALGDLEMAVEVLARVDQLDGTVTDPEIHYLRAESLWALGKRDEAWQEFKRTEQELGKGPYDYRGKLWKARIAVLRGDLETALAIYEPLLQDRDVTPATYAEVMMFKVEAHILCDDWENAERELRVFLRDNPEHQRARSLLAWALEGRGKLDEELALRAEAAAEEDDKPRKTLEYARALERANEHQAALDHYREARLLGVSEAAEGIARLERRRSPEIGGGVSMRSDPSGQIAGWIGGVTVPLSARLRISANAVHATSSGGLPGQDERTVTTASGWALMSARRGSLLALGATARLGDMPGGVGGSGIAQTSPLKDLQLQVRGDVNVPWHESASTLRDGGVMDTIGANVYLKSIVSDRKVVASFGAQARRLGLEPQIGVPMDHAVQLFGAAGVDVALTSSPSRSVRGESYDREMLGTRSLTSATVVSYRHYEMGSDNPFPTRITLVERSSIDEVSGVVRRTDRRGILGGEVRGGVGYDWVRWVTQWRAGASFLLAATPWSRFTFDYDVASESGTGIEGRQHIGSVVLHVDL